MRGIEVSRRQLLVVFLSAMLITLAVWLGVQNLLENLDTFDVPGVSQGVRR